MKSIIPILSNHLLNGENHGFLINGELHLAPALYDKICGSKEIDNVMLMNLDVIDVDEMVYTEKLDEMLIFAGQQVKVFYHGVYLGDGTVTCYPHDMHFEYAEITMHFPVRKKVLVCEITELTPILKK